MAYKNVQVAIRIRPMPYTPYRAIANAVSHDGNTVKLCYTGDNAKTRVTSFSFDRIFGPNTPSEHIFNAFGMKVVDDIIKGINGTILMYGKTGSGKTYTMMGDRMTNGMIQYCLLHLFANPMLRRTGTTLQVSFLELYNEHIRDLLTKLPKQTDIIESSDSGVEIRGLLKKTVRTLQEALDHFSRGRRKRAVGAISENCISSRSHAIFTLYLSQSWLKKDGTKVSLHSKLNLVDLAGYERLSRSGTAGIRRQESVKINLSLCNLTGVVSSLRMTNRKHIPYRNSKLTRILRDSLGGNCRTFIIVTVSPDSDSYFETLNTLRYASKAKNVQNTPIVNEKRKPIVHSQAILEPRKNPNFPSDSSGVFNMKKLMEKLVDINKIVNEALKLAMTSISAFLYMIHE